MSQDPNTFTLIIASDTQLNKKGSVHFRDGDTNVKTSQIYNDWMVKAMNDIGPGKKLKDWPNSSAITPSGRSISEPKGVVINGDLTEYGHGQERDDFKSRYQNKQKLGLSIWPSLGNHDYANNFEDNYDGTTSSNAGAIHMTEYIKEELWGGKVPNAGEILDKDGASLAYSFEIGNYHLVHLNFYPNYENDFKRWELHLPNVYIRSALPWLRKDLCTATASRKKIVLFIHDMGDSFGYPVEKRNNKYYKKDANGDWVFDNQKYASDSVVRNEQFKNFCDVISGHHIVAIFAGHLHWRHGYWGYFDVANEMFYDYRAPLPNMDLPSTGSGHYIPVFRSGGADHHTFLLTEFADTYMNIGVIDCTNGTPKFLVDIPYNTRDFSFYKKWFPDKKDKNGKIILQAGWGPRGDGEGKEEKDPSLLLSSYLLSSPEIQFHPKPITYGSQPSNEQMGVQAATPVKRRGEKNRFYSGRTNFDDYHKFPPRIEREWGTEGKFIYKWKGNEIGSNASTLLPVGKQTLCVTHSDKDNAMAPASSWVEINVLKAMPTITWPTPEAIVHGTPLENKQLNASVTIKRDGREVVLPGQFEYIPPAGSLLPAGQQNLEVSFTPDDMANYSPTSATVKINVKKATPTITWPTPEAIVQGTPIGKTQLNAFATAEVDGRQVEVEGDYSYFLNDKPVKTGDQMPAGQHTLRVRFEPNGTGNFEGATGNVPIRIWLATHVFSKYEAGNEETFSHLALKHYGHATPYYWQWIIDHNKGIIPENYKLTRAGTKVFIPEPPPGEPK